MGIQRFFSVLSVLLIPAMLISCATQGDRQDVSEASDSGSELILEYLPPKIFRFSWSASSEFSRYRLLHRYHETDDYRQVGEDIPADQISVSVSVPLFRHTQSGYLLEGCISESCTAIGQVSVSDKINNSIAYLKASNPGKEAYFGRSVSINSDGRVIAVGAMGDSSNARGPDGDQNNNRSPKSGAAYVFILENNQWLQQAYLKPHNADPQDFFGISVNLSDNGEALAISAIGEDSNSAGVNGSPINNAAADSGAVYLFEKRSGKWKQTVYFKASNPDPRDGFGYKISLSGDGRTLAIGAPGESSNSSGVNADQQDNSAIGSGAVYVFSKVGGQWRHDAYIKAENTNSKDAFGFSLSLDDKGEWLAVGAHGEDSRATGINGDKSDNSVFDSGAVFLYRRLASRWEFHSYLKAEQPDMSGSFGTHVNLSGNGQALAVGMPFNHSQQRGVGNPVADRGAWRSGAVYLYRRSNDEWEYDAYLKASNTGEKDFFGTVNLSTDGNTLAVGAHGEGSRSSGLFGNQRNNRASKAGAVYLFSRNYGQWKQIAYVKAKHTSKGDSFGFLVTNGLSGDGNTLAVAAAGEDNGASGTTGNRAKTTVTDSGALYIY